MSSSGTRGTRRSGSGVGPHARGSVAIETPENVRGAIGRLVRYFGGEWPSLLVVTVSIVAGAALKAVGPALLGGAISQHIERDPNAAAFAGQMVTVAGIFLGGWLADALSGGFMTRAANRLVYRLRRDCFSHLQKLSMSYFDRVGVGDVVSRVTNDIEMIYNALTNGFASLLGGMVSIVGILAAMLILDIRLSLVVVSLLPLIAIATAVIGKLVRAAYRENQKLVGRLTGTINESVAAARLIQSFHAEKQTFDEFERISFAARGAGTRAEVIGFAVHPLMRIVNGFAGALVVGVGGYLAVTEGGVYTVGLITSFVIYARRFFEPMRQLSELYNLIQRSLAGAERVFEVLDTTPEITNAANARVLDALRGDVAFETVTFGYSAEKPVIHDITLEVKSGEVVAIVGPTGAGKTTLVNLLSRFYDVNEGRILVDGQDVRDIDLDSLRTRMGVVLQEPYFFADTIMANIKYADPSASDEAAVEAAKAANADHFIRRLPEGYDTKLLERGANVSEGERQLLAIARALLADPRILVLDEATSSVDSLTESIIRDGVRKLMEGRTTFIIAHRLSTIRHADQVVVLHDRRIVERGTHEQLMHSGGFYARLYRMQFERPEITEEMDV